MGRLGVVSLFAAAWFGAAQGAARATDITVDCDLGDSIGAALAALDQAGPHTINVRGICLEAITISERDRVTITGAATIDATGTGLPVINIARSHIVIDGLTLTGGSVGLRVGRGSGINASNVRSHDNQAPGVLVSTNSVLVGSVMQLDHNGSAGIRVDSGVASLDNMTIEDNAGNGVAGAAAQISLLADDDNPSWISRNGGSGIALADSSRGNFAGPSITVEGNSGFGVLTVGGSAIDLFGATVTNNGHTGIDVRGTSHGEFGDLVVRDNGAATVGGGIRVADNSDISIDGNISVTDNTGVGVRAELGGHLSSRNGNTISGNTGDGVNVRRMGVARFLAPDTVVGNGGDALTCDKSSLVVGDLTGFPKVKCTDVDQGAP